MTRKAPIQVQSTGIETLNPMQRAMHEAYHASRADLVLLSPVGSGKTIAYLYPLLESLDPSRPELQAIVLVPSRELALQTQSVVRTFASHIIAHAIHGGHPLQTEQRMLLGAPPHLLIATPGRLVDHLNHGSIQVRSVRQIVVDEFDKSLELGFHDQMASIIRRLPHLQRRLLLSATPLADIPTFVGLRSPQYLDFLQTESRLHHQLLPSFDPDKLDALHALLLTFGAERSIVFVSHREAADRVAQSMSQRGFSVSLYHGGLEQDQRQRALIRFVGQSTNILVCTDLGARGLDLPIVDHVVHYHLPATSDVYIHRNGRATRYDRHGSSTLILGPHEALPDFVAQHQPESFVLPSPLPSIVPPPMTTIYIGKGKQHRISRADILGLFCQVGGLTGAQIGRIDICPRESYCAVERNVAPQLLTRLDGQKIKGIRTIYREVRH